MAKKQMVIVSEDELNDLSDMSGTSVFSDVKSAKDWVKEQIAGKYNDGDEDGWFIYELKPLFKLAGEAVDVKIKETKL